MVFPPTRKAPPALIPPVVLAANGSVRSTSPNGEGQPSRPPLPTPPQPRTTSPPSNEVEPAYTIHEHHHHHPEPYPGYAAPGYDYSYPVERYDAFANAEEDVPLRPYDTGLLPDVGVEGYDNVRLSTPVPVGYPQPTGPPSFHSVDREPAYDAPNFDTFRSRSPTGTPERFIAPTGDVKDADLANPEYYESPILDDTQHFGRPPEERILRRNKTKKRIPLTSGNLVVDLPIPSELDKVLFNRDLPEMQSVRYTAVTCDPDEFEAQNFTLRQSLASRRTELAVCITMYNEDEILFTRTLYGVMKNIAHLVSRKNSSKWGHDSWKKVVIVIIADGRTKCHPRVLDCLAAMGVYQEGVAKNEMGDKPVEAHLFEYTTSLCIGPDLQFKGPDKKIVPTQIIFCLKEKNAKKINSHRWFFNGFCPVLQPNVCVLLDVGTRPGVKSLYHLWKAFDRNSSVGGACGEIRADVGSRGRLLLNPLVASQNFEYKMSNILDKTTESAFGYISVLPGAFSAYRYIALKNDAMGVGPLASYFKGEKLHTSDESVFARNMYLAEDRILCFELVAKKGESWVLKYVKEAVGETDVPGEIPELISQRRRWLNGSFFAAIYALWHTGQVLRSGHSTLRKIALLVETIYSAINLLFSWFAIANFFLFYSILTRALEDPSFGVPKISILNSITQSVYGGLVVACFTFALGNRPQGSHKKYTTVIIAFAVLSIYMIVAAIICTVQVSKQSRDNAIYAQMVVSLIATYGVWVVASVLSLDPWHLFTSLPQYLLFAASQTNVLTTYAFSNLHDLSWGTKGDLQAPKDLGVVKASKDGMAEIEIYAEQRDVDISYADALHKLKTRMPVPKPLSTAVDREREQADYLASFRSNVLLAWVLTNGALVIGILYGTGGDSVLSQSATGSKTQIYMLFILIFVAITNAIKLLGCICYLVSNLFGM